jgi:hypothetical protein
MKGAYQNSCLQAIASANLDNNTNTDEALRVSSRVM